MYDFCWFHQIVSQLCVCLDVVHQFRGESVTLVKTRQGFLVLCLPQIKLRVNSSLFVCIAQPLLNVSSLTSFNRSKCSVKGLHCSFKILDQLKLQLLSYRLSLSLCECLMDQCIMPPFCSQNSRVAFNGPFFKGANHGASSVYNLVWGTVCLKLALLNIMWVVDLSTELKLLWSFPHNIWVLICAVNLT